MQAEEKIKKRTDHPTQGYWHEMNRKQRRETMRKILREELSLEVVHPDAASENPRRTHWPARVGAPVLLSVK